MTSVQESEKNTILFLEGILFSYSQVFFSRNKVFAFILMLVSFFDWAAGLSGLLAVLVANMAAQLIGFRRWNVAQGFYGFNSLLVGLGLGMMYQPTATFFLVLVFAALFTFFLTIWLEGFFAKYGLPYLSWPFLLALWMIGLATRHFAELDINDRGVFLLNDMYRYGGIWMVNTYHWFNALPVHDAVHAYFKSLAAIFFQVHLLAGMLIAFGLLIFSRIAFLLSLLGFFSAYLFYALIGANITDLNYSYIGFNFILSAIAVGGIYVVPSRYSFLWVILLTPIITVVIVSATAILLLFKMPVYSLGFNVVVILFLYTLKIRERNYTKPTLVLAQYFSPEQNLYNQQNYQSRFGTYAFLNVYLPVMGEWTITQAHNGAQTHRDDWRHAWDFELFDNDGNKFEKLGNKPSDYYCFGQPVVAPADGFVQEVIEGIPDNNIGDVNLNSNWGNTVVLKHSEYLYSKHCHLKTGSVKVAKGAWVKRGEVIAAVGNSGRSPVPHLHFQFQAQPFVGAKTLDYPFANYFLKEQAESRLLTYGKPVLNDQVSNVLPQSSLVKAFGFVVGQTVRFKVEAEDNNAYVVDWEVKTDMYNYSFLECKHSGAKAYYQNDGKVFSFTHFEGSKKGLLYCFYLSCFKVSLGYADRLVINDTFPLTAFRMQAAGFLHDFVAPFAHFVTARYHMDFVGLDDDFSSSSVRLGSRAVLKVFGRAYHTSVAAMEITDGRFTSFVFEDGRKKLVAGEEAI